MRTWWNGESGADREVHAILNWPDLIRARWGRETLCTSQLTGLGWVGSWIGFCPDCCTRTIHTRALQAHIHTQALADEQMHTKQLYRGSHAFVRKKEGSSL